MDSKDQLMALWYSDPLTLKMSNGLLNTMTGLLRIQTKNNHWCRRCSTASPANYTFQVGISALWYHLLIISSLCALFDNWYFICYLYFFSNIVHHYFHISWCFYPLPETRRVSLVEQELLALLEHMSPSQFSVGFVLSNL